MKALFKIRTLLTVIGVILLALFIWYAGPLFAFGPYRPLEPPLVRIIVIALVIVGMVVAKIIKRLKANKASDNLIAAVVKQSATETKQTAEAQQLRERFEEAVATLKQKRRSGNSLYDLPWYVIIGAPGSGKTTALVNSGLKFPIEQRSGKAALRGVGGTRNCDWWFTDQAVLLDTAGRYTTQDSDASADSAAWAEFLALLRKYRGRRPINGVILTISAQDLMIQDAASRDAHIAAARRRLDELNRELRMQLPVYVMVTKCDLVAGFTEYFDDQPQQGRAQVWGVTFPYDDTVKGVAAREFPTEFDTLIARLNERLMQRLEEERDVRRRARVFGFPQQMAALREPLSSFISDVFASTRFDKPLLMRGVYFTSGTQEGTPIDRLLGALGRQFAVAPESVITPGGRGKAYFIERLLMDVMFSESGLAGVNRRVEVQKGALQLAAYVLMTLIAVVGVVVFTGSYRGNRSYIADVDAEVKKLSASAPPSRSASLDSRLPRLDAVRAVYASANRFEEMGAPLSMRWGLFQGNALGNAARDAYARELNDVFLSQVTARFRQRLIDYAAEPEKLYEYLKGYLMLGDAEHFDPEQLRFLAGQEWEEAYGARPGVRDSVAGHFNALLASGQIRPQQLDNTVVSQARNTLSQASKAGLVYRYLKIQYAKDTARALRLDQEAGLGADRVLRRKSRISLSMPLPSLYTRDVFNEIVASGTADLVKQFAEESWVWGADAPALTGTTGLNNELLNVYEKDYIAFWDGIVHDIETVPLGALANAKQSLAILSGPTSPLRGLLKAIDKHTFLQAPKDPNAASAGGVRQRIEDVFKSAAGRVGGAPAVTPGAQVTAHFADIHKLVAGDAGTAPIDGILKTLQQIQEKLAPLGDEVGGKAPDAGSIGDIGDLTNTLKRDAAPLPPTVGAVFTEIANASLSAVSGNTRGNLTASYEMKVLNECRTLANGKFPIVAGSTNDMPIADFTRLFGPSGVFDSYFKTELEPLVNQTRSPWSWRTNAAGVPVGGGVPLSQFELVGRIREQFFPSSKAEARFTLTADGLDRESTRFTLEIDGQEARNRHDPPRAVPMVWPGPKPGLATATFEPPGGPNFAAEGPWAMFRLLEIGQLTRETDSRYLLTLKRGTREVQLRIEADSARNPFGKLGELQRFRCE
jgi:type VI secretion system protein ImpL